MQKDCYSFEGPSNYHGPRGNICWPVAYQPNQMPASGDVTFPRCIPEQEVSWPVSETWRRNKGQPRCAGPGTCQGDHQICNYKYQYGVDDVGPCPSEQSCKSSYCCAPCPPVCTYPCPAVPSCNRLTTRCFDWPLPQRERCAVTQSGFDLRPPRAALNVQDDQPERCPTCKRIVVDMACGPLGYNY
ncbi:unnamed protein product [Candidula unifasciata]|uniref:Uncharacterized protein n=1 Tax=Candidula unifasciata TaxID=100452 RepID=A0A8S3YMY1_9EUPU|nr:unnamed protein product [Candidula unifasciata]